MPTMYRTIVKTTHSLQPNGDTHWEVNTAYCGYSLDDARVAYYEQELQDSNRGFGNFCRRTTMERLQVDAEFVQVNPACEEA